MSYAAGLSALLVMRASIPAVKAPFRNLEFPITLNRAVGLVSCSLVNGRFKQSSIWNRCYCVLWLLLHCTYSTVYYYKSFTALSAEEIDIYMVLPIVRFSAFFASLLPYHLVVLLHSPDFVKVSVIALYLRHEKSNQMYHTVRRLNNESETNNFNKKGRTTTIMTKIILFYLWYIHLQHRFSEWHDRPTTVLTLIILILEIVGNQTEKIHIMDKQTVQHLISKPKMKGCVCRRCETSTTKKPRRSLCTP